MPVKDLSGLTAEAIEAMAAAIEVDYVPDHLPKSSDMGAWQPDLNPTQRKIFDDTTPFILAYGEKGAGKSIAVSHKLVRHCYENWDALGLIFTPSIRTGKFGAIHDLETLVLPAWEEGIDLEWLPSKLDPNTKDRILKVANRFGGWSTILQISIPYEAAIGARIKGIHPSFIFGDELTDCDGRGYFSTMIGQLGRRRGITGPQQYVAACNPEGPSHWVYQVFFVEPQGDRRFATYHVPYRENAHRPELRDYLATLEAATKVDPVLHARLVEGRWLDRPTGDALFKDYYNPQRHVIGNADEQLGLRPMKGLPCIIGYDLGQVFNAAVFMQNVPTEQGNIWIVFDEVAHLNRKILYRTMATEICQRMKEWNANLGSPIIWEHMADDSAINQWRPGASGSYDAWDFEKEFNAFSAKQSLPFMRMKGCPKGPGSIEARVRVIQGKLYAGQILISDGCLKVQETLLLLKGQKDNPLKPLRTVEGHIHVFDALSGPMLKFEVNGSPQSFTGALVKIVKTTA